MFWKDTETPEEAKLLQDRMWGLVKTASDHRIEFRVRGEGLYQDGEFWFEAARRVRAWPKERLRIAEEHFPMPGAFQEAAISLRALVRDKRACNQDYQKELAWLYDYAAIFSFYVPYAPPLMEPGYNVMARVPFSEFRSMDLTWDRLGYDKLQLLTKMDRRLMVAAWGEPQVHSTAYDAYRSVWDRYEEILIKERAGGNKAQSVK